MWANAQRDGRPVWQRVWQAGLKPVVKPVVQPGLTTGWTNSCSFNTVVKLDRSRVLVTKFGQSRLTLKGRSAGQTHTHTHTHTHIQTRLKIRALQVCNRANSVGLRQWTCERVWLYSWLSIVTHGASNCSKRPSHGALWLLTSVNCELCTDRSHFCWFVDTSCFPPGFGQLFISSSDFHGSRYPGSERQHIILQMARKRMSFDTFDTHFCFIFDKI